MYKKKVLILLGHPDCDTLSGHLADSYERGACDGGHEVRRINICDLEFDPILHKGYKEIQELEPDLIKVQENFKWAEHVVIVYPNWWCTMPALLKGLFDRMFLPGFAFRFSKEDSAKWEKLLTGRSARVIIAAGMNPIKIRFNFGDFTNEISRGILGFAGFNPVEVTTFGPSERATDANKKSWHKKVYNFGKKAI
ncbi:MAG: NAD(P)H-dependent oxidoreductase [Candidatus Pacebacteria bacterium]|jgi:putative NADPH-quinone reductase|nr:NADPH:quinone reductase [Parcubacteria group bacterium]MDP6249357.1 NAD(P)H-dependent oxidoreductase [Candidatus Paceibacterota bacterium]